MGKVHFAKVAAVVLALTCFLTGCSGSGSTGSVSSDSTAAPTTAKVFKISHNQQTTHPVHVALEQMKKNVEERTNGSVVLELHPAGALADDVTALDQVTLGVIEGAIVMNSPNLLFVGTGSGLGYIEELPFLFEDAETARAAYDGALGDAFKTATEECGLHIVNFWENGFRNMTNSTRPIVTPDDMKGIKFRIANSDIRQMTFDALGAGAIPMAFSELFTALQQGTVDGQENPLSIIETSKFYEVQEYLSLSRHIYTTATFIVNPAFYATLTDEERAIFEEEADLARDTMRQLNDEFEETAVAFLEEQGMQVNEIDKQAFVDAVQPVWEYFEENYGRELIDMALTAAK